MPYMNEKNIVDGRRILDPKLFSKDFNLKVIGRGILSLFKRLFLALSSNLFLISLDIFISFRISNSFS